MKATVIGGGFLGTAIATRLFTRGHQVSVLSRRRSPLLPEGVVFRRVDIMVGQDLKTFLAGSDLVVDASSSLVPSSVQERPSIVVPEAFALASWVCEETVAADVAAHVFLSSGGTVYGPSENAHRESDALAPISVYGAMKAGIELHLAALVRSYETRSIALRVSNAYGPGQNLSRPQGIIGVAMNNHRLGQATKVYGLERSIRDYIYGEDLGDLVELAFESGVDGPLNAGSGVGIGLSHLLAVVEGSLGCELVVDAYPAREFDVGTSVLDISLAKSLGWSPSTSLEQGVSTTWRWVQAVSP